MSKKYRLSKKEQEKIKEIKLFDLGLKKMMNHMAQLEAEQEIRTNNWWERVAKKRGLRVDSNLYYNGKDPKYIIGPEPDTEDEE